MNTKKTRFMLLWAFFISLVILLICLFAERSKMWPEEFLALVGKVLALYSVQLGVVLGGLFSQQRISPRQSSKTLNWSALALVSLWNLLLVSRTLVFAIAQQDSVTDYSKYLDAVGSGSAFLVAGVVSYFLSKSLQSPGLAGDRQNADMK